MISSFFLRFCDYIFVLRPVILIPAWSFFLIGASYRMDAGTRGLLSLPAPWALASLTSILITAYLLNQIFDRESDEKNNKCLFLTRGVFGVRMMVVLAMAFFAAASLSFQRVSDPERLPLVIALLLSLFYSLPPVRLCSRPLLDLLANAVGFGGVAFVLGFGMADGSYTPGIMASIPYVLLVSATFLHTAILDVDGDKASGKISTVVVIGRRPSSILAVALNAAAFVVGLVVNNPLASIVALAALPVTFLALATQTPSWSSRAVQIHTLIVAVAAGVRAPILLIVVAPLLLLSRYYHKKRFGIIYPGVQKSA